MARSHTHHPPTHTVTFFVPCALAGGTVPVYSMRHRQLKHRHIGHRVEVVFSGSRVIAVSCDCDGGDQAMLKVVQNEIFDEKPFTCREAADLLKQIFSADLHHERELWSRFERLPFNAEQMGARIREALRSNAITRAKETSQAIWGRDGHKPLPDFVSSRSKDEDVPALVWHLDRELDDLVCDRITRDMMAASGIPSMEFFTYRPPLSLHTAAVSHKLIYGHVRAGQQIVADYLGGGRWHLHGDGHIKHAAKTAFSRQTVCSVCPKSRPSSQRGLARHCHSPKHVKHFNEALFLALDAATETLWGRRAQRNTELKARVQRSIENATHQEPTETER